jgi:hypothetical protein
MIRPPGRVCCRSSAFIAGNARTVLSKSGYRVVFVILVFFLNRQRLLLIRHAGAYLVGITRQKQRAFLTASCDQQQGKQEYD